MCPYVALTEKWRFSCGGSGVVLQAGRMHLNSEWRRCEWGGDLSLLQVGGAVCLPLAMLAVCAWLGQGES